MGRKKYKDDEEKHVPVKVYLRKDLLNKVDEESKKKGQNRSSFINQILDKIFKKNSY